MSQSVTITINFNTKDVKRGSSEVGSAFKAIEKDAERAGRVITKALNVSTATLERALKVAAAALERIDRVAGSLRGFERYSNDFKRAKVDETKVAEREAAKQAAAAERTRQKEVKEAEKAAAKQIKEAEKRAAAEERAREKEIKAAERAAAARERAAEKVARTEERAAQQAARAVERAEQEKKRAVEQSARAQEDAIKRAAATQQQAYAGMRSAGLWMTTAITLALVGASIASVKFAGDLQLSVAKIASIKPEINTSEVESQLNWMSTRVPQSAAQLGDALYDIFSSINVTQAEGLQLVEQFAKGAVGAATDAQTFGTAVMGVMGAYGLSVKDAAHVSDVFFNTVAQGVVTGPELAAGLGNLAKSAKAAGVNIDDLGGLIVGSTKAGGDAAQNMNNLNNLLMKFTTKDAQKELNALRIKTDDGKGGFRNMIDVMGDLKTKLAGMSEIESAQTLQKIFPDAQARLGAQTVIEQLDAVREAVRVTSAETLTAGRLTEAAYQKIGGTFNSQMTLLKNTVIAGITELGAQVLPVLTPLVIELKERLVVGIKAAKEAFDALAPAGKIAVVAVLGIVAAIGPVLTVIGTLGIALPAIKAGFLAIGAVVGSVFSPIGLAIAAVVVAVGLLAAAWYTNFGGLRDYTVEVWNAIQTAASAGMNYLRSLWDTYGAQIIAKAMEVWNAIVEVVRPAFAAVVNVMRENFGFIVAWVAENWPLIQQTIKTVLEAVGAYVSAFTARVAAFWKEHGEQITGIISGAWTIVRTIIQTGMRNILDVIKIVMQVIQGDWSGAWDTLKIIVARTISAIGTVLGGLWQIIWNALKLVVTAIINSAGEWLSAGRDLGVNLASGIKNGIASGAGAVWGAMKSMVRGAITAGNQEADIHSPSRVTFKQGQFLAQGLILGMQSEQAAVDAAFARMIIPEKPRTAVGKGAAKINRSNREAYAVNEPGYKELTKLYEDTDKLKASGDRLKEVIAEIGQEYARLDPKVKTAIANAVAENDAQRRLSEQRKQSADFLKQTSAQVADAMFEYAAGADGAITELEKFDYALSKIPVAARPAQIEIAEVRRQLGELAKAKEADKARKVIDEFVASVQTLNDEAGVALRDFGRTSSTELDKLAEKFVKLKGSGLKLSDFDGLKEMASSLSAMPEPARLAAIAEFIDRLYKERRGSMTPQQWDELRLGLLGAVNATIQLDEAQAKADGAKKYTDAIGELNEKLSDNNGLSERVRVEKLLETEAYKNLTREQREALVVRAAEIDQAKALAEQQKLVRERWAKIGEDIRGAMSNALSKLVKLDFKGAWDEIKKGFKQVWSQVMGDLLQSGIQSVFRSVFGGIFKGITGGSNSGQGNGGGGGFSLGSLLSTIGGFFGFGKSNSSSRGSALTGGFAGGNPASAILGKGFNFLSSGAASGVTNNAALNAGFGISGLGSTSAGAPLTTLTSTLTNQATSRSMIHEAGHAALSGAAKAPGLFSGLGFGAKAGSGGALAAMLPLLGASLGGGLVSGLAGPQAGGLANLMGTAGGALIGIGLSATPAVFAAGGALGGLSGVAGALFSNPITAIVGGALLLGGIIYGKNKQRRADEKKRTDIINTAFSNLDTLLREVNTNNLDGEAALAQAADIRSEYLSAVSQIKDKKTRRIATLDVSRLDVRIDTLKLAAKKQQERVDYTSGFKQEFATGGVIQGARGRAVEIIGHAGEIVSNDSQHARLGRLLMGMAGVPGVGGGAPQIFAAPSSNGGGMSEPRIEINVVMPPVMIGRDDIGRMMEIGATTSTGKRALVRFTRNAADEGEFD